MISSNRTADLFSLATLPDARGYGAEVLALLPQLRHARHVGSAATLFRRALRSIGADSGVFLSAIREDASRSVYRSLCACDPLWAIECSRAGWHDNDPWLRHALFNEEPIRSSDLRVEPSEDEFVRKSSGLGFASALVVPAPSSAGACRVGVLVLGSSQSGFFDGEGYELVRIVVRALSMELHTWLLRAVRDDLLERSRITPGEIELLRHEEAGHTSKRIAARLGVTPKCVDMRIQRATAKLNAPDRRTAARIARLYGLL